MSTANDGMSAKTCAESSPVLHASGASNYDDVRRSAYSCFGDAPLSAFGRSSQPDDPC